MFGVRHLKPARGVGGVLFDLSLLSENRLVLVVGDVCGKGVPASLFMSATVMALRIAAQHERDICPLIGLPTTRSSAKRHVDVHHAVLRRARS